MNMALGPREYLRGEIVGDVDLARLFGPLEVPAVPERWYILRVFPGREFQVMKKFHQRNISCAVLKLTSPQELTRYRRGFEWIERRNVVSPLFSGAVLMPDFEIEQERWRDVSGTIGIYRYGDFVPTLTPKLYSDLFNIEKIANTPKSKRKRLFEVGQLVRVVNGPFRSFCGQVERFDSTGRLSVGVNIFSRITPVELGEGDIEAVKADRRPRPGLVPDGQGRQDASNGGSQSLRRKPLQRLS